LLAVLRRLPPPAPGSLIGAVQAALDASDAGALRELGDSAQPLVAAVATYALSSALADAGDEAGALSAARRMLKLLGEDGYPWLRAVAHARIGEFCLRLEPGEEAFRQLSAALALAERLGARASAIRARWAIVLADLQRGAVDEAERGLDRLTREDGADSAGWPMFGVWARAEIRLAHGDVGGGLQLWREAADHLRDDDGAWAREVQAAAVTAHARHGRLDQIGDLVARLPSMLATSLGAATVTDFPVCGSLMLALGLADLAPEAEVDSSADADADADAGPGRSAAMADAADPIDVGTVADSVAGAAPAGGRGRVGTADNADPAGAVGRGGGRGRIETVDDVDPAGPAGAVRLVALAERFGWQRGFQPALSADWVRAVAEQAGRPAYAAAVTAYAGLDHEGLRLAGLAALQVRERVIGGVRG
jgi:hypothetical protein